MKRILFLLIFLYAQTSISTELKGTPEELKRYFYPNKVTVTLHGYAERVVQSDTATVSIIVSTEAKEMRGALAENSRIRQQVIATLVNSGIAKNDIQTASFSTSPEIGYFSKRPTSYNSVNKINVAVTTEQQFSAVASLVDEFKSVSLGEIKYKHSKKKELNRELVSEALADVIAKKVIYEEQLGIKLKVYDIGSLTNRNRYESDGIDEEIVVTGLRRSSYSQKSSTPEPLSFGELNYSTHRSVTFEIIESD
ncbi:SIMPL domain-containing protein [bacterium SCSIO 12696]|nr:SIMPL domain-containing protein [bacterium SCSIO 12696]